MYLKGVEGDTPKYAVPILETDFSDFPSTHTTVGSLDRFRDKTMSINRSGSNC
ncbi:TPA: hypothetical protein SGA20_002767 [Staphylococcus aureus]|nr:hypothetical protein [Staphylococcus aureus]HEG9099391.1 hypothetical protein [Staphylococcus aureus]